MGTTRSFLNIPMVAIFLIIGLCVGLSTFSVMNRLEPKVRSFMDHTISRFDAYVPEIAINNGSASIKQPQPYYVDFGQGKEMPIVIDTRPGHEKEGVNYLKDAKSGFVLTRDSVLLKNGNQFRSTPLKDMPNLAINSHSLRSMADEYFPAIEKAMAGVTLIYFLFAKLFQVSVLALIPYRRVRTSPALTYGQAFKIAAVCMAPPVLLNLCQDMLDTHLPGRSLIYFGFYLILLFLASRDLIRSFQEPQQTVTEIQP